MTFSIKALLHDYDEGRILFIFILNVVMLNVIMQSVVKPNLQALFRNLDSFIIEEIFFIYTTGVE